MNFFRSINYSHIGYMSEDRIGQVCFVSGRRYTKGKRWPSFRAGRLRLTRKSRSTVTSPPWRARDSPSTRRASRERLLGWASRAGCTSQSLLVILAVCAVLSS
ncbi:hypothetical protein MRX96_000272 [Rhipicephalus microplus]